MKIILLAFVVGLAFMSFREEIIPPVVALSKESTSFTAADRHGHGPDLGTRESAIVIERKKEQHLLHTEIAITLISIALVSMLSTLWIADQIRSNKSTQTIRASHTSPHFNTPQTGPLV